MPEITEDLRKRLEILYKPVPPETSSNPAQHQSNPNANLGQSQQPASNSSLSHHDSPLGHVVRSLPQVPVSEDNLVSQFGAFILYCNPAIPMETDQTELQNIFKSPPKSDGKSFSTWTLFELIKKLESKEIKTWAQLALDLGVEPPALDKGQSAQKVQQYAVRLKRWMHAMHVDAFFEYLMKKPHPYWTHIPSLDGPPLQGGRDGVPAEEDLALRALLPETRPKRGRRKNEDREDSELQKSPAQRPRISSPALSEDLTASRVPRLNDERTAVSLAPATSHSFEERTVPWSAMEPQGQLGAFRWPPSSNDSLTPMSAYPHSAITPTTRTHIWGNEPQSAITPKARSRRKHGPAVSSAWPSSTTPGSKLRGRPPSNRTVQDGPFSTFPVTPITKESSLSFTAEKSASISTANAEPTAPFYTHNITRGPQGLTSTPPTQPGRPSRLSLQVPHRESGSIRLATPPPVVLLNGERESTSQSDSANPRDLDDDDNNNTAEADSTSAPSPFHLTTHATPPSRMLLLRQIDTDDKDTTHVSALTNHVVAELLSATWHSSTGEPTERCTIDEATTLAKQLIKHVRMQAFSEEMYLLNVATIAGMHLLTTELVITRLDPNASENADGGSERPPPPGARQYKISRRVQLGSFQFPFEMVLTVAAEDDGVDGTDAAGVVGGDGSEKVNENGGEGAAEEGWKKKYLELQREMRLVEEKAKAAQREVLDVVLSAGRAVGL